MACLKQAQGNDQSAYNEASTGAHPTNLRTVAEGDTCSVLDTDHVSWTVFLYMESKAKE